MTLGGRYKNMNSEVDEGVKVAAHSLQDPATFLKFGCGEDAGSIIEPKQRQQLNLEELGAVFSLLAIDWGVI